MDDEEVIVFQVIRNETVYQFKFGSEAYIFHTGIYNGIDTKYGEGALLEYVKLVQECYLKDDSRTPLGALADFVAENWEEAKTWSRREILEKFYEDDC